MIRRVIDASCIGALLIPDEAENLMPGLISALEEGACVVPAHWRYEVANLSLVAVRRKRVASDEIAKSLADLASYSIEIDAAGTVHAWSRTYRLAERHGLTIYDAAYLELALRLSTTMFSLDEPLLQAARAEGVATESLS